MAWLTDTVGLDADKATTCAKIFADNDIDTVEDVAALSMEELKHELSISLGIRKKLQPFLQ